MENALRALLLFMLSKRYIGGKHTPEKKAIKLKTKWLSSEEVKEFNREYKQMINDGFFMKTKKKTGKGTSWHLSLNPRRIKELKDIL